MPRVDPTTLLADLDPEQLDAVKATSGPVVIHAGAGSGKTRVISRRTAYAIATEVVPADQVLVVTFTDKAATEMVARLRSLGLPGVTARTFHAHALSQLRHFWPAGHDGAALPDLLDSKLPIISRLARQLPGHYRFTPSKDLADEIEWAKARRIAPTAYEREAAAANRESPIPVDLFARIFADYERAKTRANRIDFDDLLVETVVLLESDADAAATVRLRKSWFSVDEYQDTNPLQQRLLELWLGDRDDLCVVGDEDQTIYTFTGATSDYLTAFTERHPGAREVTLSRNYRSSPEILALANRLLASEGRRKQLIATVPAGRAPTIRGFTDGEKELAAIVASIRGLVGDPEAAGAMRTGMTQAAEIAILVRINAQIPPIEAALTKARIPFRVRGQRFFERQEVRDALRLLKKIPETAIGPMLAHLVEERLITEMGYLAEDDSGGPAARERTASLALVIELAQEAAAADPSVNPAGLLAEFSGRATAEAEGSADGVNLLTYHRAKGLEWDAVFLPQIEEGTLPMRQANTEQEIAEERRLLYVGLTRARRHLELSWAEKRDARRRPSRFLAALEGRASVPGRVNIIPGAPMNAGTTRRARDEDSPLMNALVEWRLTAARSDGVPAYVIAPDTLLIDIAAQRPTTIPALRRMKGMGPSRLARYGAEIIEITTANR
ncbi:MAG: ATP-dependent DNA helicase UvrD2 [Chloroflexota bacterium]